MINWDFLQELCSIPGVSGEEKGVRERILRELEPLGNVSFHTTPLGCLTVKKQGRKKASVSVLICAPMDEPGFLVSRICDDGTVKLTPVGDISGQALCGRPVTVCTAKGELPGVLGAKPVHLLTAEERGKPVPAGELYLDIGALSKEEAGEAVYPGDRVVFASPWSQSGNMVFGRSLTSRAACAVLVSLLHRNLEFDLTAAFITQGETGAGGLMTVVHDVQPDVVLCIEGAQASSPDEEDGGCALGKGPSVSFMDTRMVYDSRLFRGVIETARRLHIPCQERTAVDGDGSAGRAASQTGARTLMVRIPVRYPGVPVSMTAKEDLESIVRLLEAVCPEIAAGSF